MISNVIIFLIGGLCTGCGIGFAIWGVCVMLKAFGLDI